MTAQEAIEKLKEESLNGDYESAHGNADDILCEFLKALGYQDVVNAWDEVGKWYA